jgi:hypothetical protein
MFRKVRCLKTQALANTWLYKQKLTRVWKNSMIKSIIIIRNQVPSLIIAILGQKLLLINKTTVLINK